MSMPDQNLSPRDYSIACWVLACDSPKEFKPKQEIHDKVVASGLTSLLDFEEYKKAVPAPYQALWMLYLGRYHDSVPFPVLGEMVAEFNKVYKYKRE